MDLPKLIAQWTELHDACLAEAQTLVGAQCNAEMIHTLAETASICVDALLKLNGEPQPIISVRDLVYGVPNRSDLP